jgi:hypothetical protein
MDIMHEVGYHVDSETIYTVGFDELIEILQWKYSVYDIAYYVTIRNEQGIMYLVLYRKGDYIEYYGKRYKYPDLGRFCLEWRNIQTEKAIDSL